MSQKAEFDYLREGDLVKVRAPNGVIRTGEILGRFINAAGEKQYKVKYTDFHVNNGLVGFETIPAEWVCFYLGRHTNTGGNSMAAHFTNRETLEKMTKNEVIEMCLNNQEELSNSLSKLGEVRKEVSDIEGDKQEWKKMYEDNNKNLIKKNGVIMEMQATIEKQEDTIRSLTAELEIANKDLTDLQRRYDVTRDITEEKQSLNIILNNKINSLSSMLTAISETAINAKKII